MKRRVAQNAKLAERLGVAVLLPVFPRPASDWKIYTHALDRDATFTDRKQFARFELQLIAMIEDVRARLKKENLNFDKRVLMIGFSALRMFVNRFSLLKDSITDAPLFVQISCKVFRDAPSHLLTKKAEVKLPDYNP